MPISREKLVRWALRFQPLIALLMMVAALSVLSSNFLTPSNGTLVLGQISVNVCLSIGMTLIILTGGIDLSVGSVAALSAAVMGGLITGGIALPAFNVLLEFTPYGAVLAGLLVGLSLGLFNGLMITALRIPPFVATLGMMGIARGLTELFTGGESITGLEDTYGRIATDDFLWIPLLVWLCGALAGAFIVVTRKTRFGRGLYAVGGNEQAARLSGLGVNRIKLAAYALAGLLSAVGGLVLIARVGAADAKAAGGYELDAIAAVVIGGTSLSGGRGSIPGTLLGCLIIGVLNSGLNLAEVSSSWQLVVKGVVILAAVAIDKWNVGRR